MLVVLVVLRPSPGPVAAPLLFPMMKPALELGKLDIGRSGRREAWKRGRRAWRQCPRRESRQNHEFLHENFVFLLNELPFNPHSRIGEILPRVIHDLLRPNPALPLLKEPLDTNNAELRGISSDPTFGTGGRSIFDVGGDYYTSIFH